MASSAKDSRSPSSATPAPAHKPAAQASLPAACLPSTAKIQNPKSKIQNLPPPEITAALKSAAHALGFSLTGVCPAVAPTGLSRLADWLDRGYAGQMHYIAARQEAYSHPRHVLDGCRSILMLGLPYVGRAVPAESNPKFKIQNPKSPPPGSGRISSYASGPADYHDTIHAKLKQLIATLHDLAPHATARGVVDTAPLLEREFAQLAGLGWTGKHTLLISKPQSINREGEAPAEPNPKSKIQNPKSFSGSYFFLAALLTDLELAYDNPFTADHCGTCRACLDACPTNAFPHPYVLDATRCISYLTIELRDHIPRDLRPALGDWLFGCDICQDVCPWNQHAVGRALPADAPDETSPDSNPKSKIQNPKSELSSPIDLIELFSLDDAAFRARFRHTPLWRPRRRGILRNAAIILGNQFRGAGVSPAVVATDATAGSSSSAGEASAQQVVAVLTRGLHDPELLIRDASAWALGQIATPAARAALEVRQTIETDATIRNEIASALRAIAPLST